MPVTDTDPRSVRTRTITPGGTSTRWSTLQPAATNRRHAASSRRTPPTSVLPHVRRPLEVAPGPGHPGDAALGRHHLDSAGLDVDLDARRPGPACSNVARSSLGKKVARTATTTAGGPDEGDEDGQRAGGSRDDSGPVRRQRARKRSSCSATGAGPAPPAVVRRRTAAPGSSRAAASGPELGWAATSSASGAPPAGASRTSPATTWWASRNGMPAATSHSARSTAAAAARARRRPLPSGRRRTWRWPAGRPARRGPRFDLLDRVEQRLLVLLEVPVVGQGQALERDQQPGQVADQAPGLAPGQLGHVGVLLLGQHRAARGPGVGQAQEAELGARPQHDLLADAGQVDAEQGQVEQRLGHEVAVADRVEGVLEGAGEARGRRRWRPGRAAATSRPGRRRPGATRRGAGGCRRGGRRRGPAPSRGPAGGGPAGPAGPAAGGCSRGGRPRRRASARSSSTSCRASTRSPTPASSRLAHRRRSVATWSLRLRPVWSAPADRPGQLGHPALDRGVDVLVGGGEREGARRPARRRPSSRAASRAPASSSDSRPGPGQPPHVGARAGHVVGRHAPVDSHEAGRERPQLLAAGPPPEASAGAARTSVTPAEVRALAWRLAQVCTPRLHRRTKPAASSWWKRSAAS